MKDSLRNYDIIKDKISAMKENLPGLRNHTDDYVFTALCVKSNYYKNPSFSFDEKIVEDFVVDSVNDGGVDAIFSDPNSETSNLILCQSKFYQNITFDQVRDAISKMIIFYNSMQRGDYESINQRVQSRFLNLNAEVGEESKVCFVFYTSAEKNGIRKDRLNKLLQEYGLDSSVFEIDIYFGEDLTNEIKEAESRRSTVESGKIKLDQKNNVLFYGDEAAIVNVSAFSIKELYATHSINLLSKNLRYFIKKGDIDSSINDTIVNSPETFWFKNNGITIICDDFDIDGIYVKLKNFSIINGGQTTNLIHKSKEINATYDFYIPCKIIKANGDEEFSLAIAKATNSQKAIKQIDLKANAPEQVRFANELRNKQIYYQTKRGEVVPKDYKDPHKNTDLAEVGKLGLAGIFQLPGSSRSKPSSLYLDKYYNPVFKEDQKQIAGIIKDLLYTNTYYARFLKEYEKKANAALSGSLLPFANNARTICISFTALAFRYHQKNLTEEHMGVIFNHLNKDKAYDDYYYDIFRDLGNLNQLFPKSLSENKDELDEVLFQLFSLIINEGCKLYQIKKGYDNTLNESNFLKKDLNYYEILKSSWYDMPQKIYDILK